jgi:hypothetical protein
MNEKMNRLWFGYKIFGGRRILETAEERVKLLKAGLSVKTIEILYIESNNFKIVK